MNNLFDTDVQKLKYDVLTEIARLAFADQLTPRNLMNIKNIIVPDGKPKMRCCIYKERAIVDERVEVALGGDVTKKNIVEVLQIACDECPISGIEVTQACRGCIAHRCQNACPKGAINIVNRHAEIDKSKCIECGRCVAACSYSAIVKHKRPCINACKPGAISINAQTQKAQISEDKCISCGACVYQCPFGAISDKSYITEIIRLIRDSKNNTRYHTYAVVAPSIAAQYANQPEITLGKVVQGIKQLGFGTVVEAALGADVIAYLEAQELVEKGFLTSSCCPAFVSYIRKNYKSLEPNISSNLSPMAQISKIIKEQNPTARVVFIGPCIAKKGEGQQPRVRKYVDGVMTFEEMQALMAAKNIDLASLEEAPIDAASLYGRIFARSCGVSEAVEEALKERGSDFKVSALPCSGIAECKAALLKASKGLLKENFIEGMACEGGCIGGPAALSHSVRDKSAIETHGKQSQHPSIQESLENVGLQYCVGEEE